MKEWPNPFWALMFVALGCVLVTVALFAPYRENVTPAVVTMGASIITGAFGYIQGTRASSSQNPT